MNALLVVYLEAHGGSLSRSNTRTKWPDGTITDFAWQYSADNLVTEGRTWLEAVGSHREFTKREYENTKV